MYWDSDLGHEERIVVYEMLLQMWWTLREQPLFALYPMMMRAVELLMHDRLNTTVIIQVVLI